MGFVLSPSLAEVSPKIAAHRLEVCVHLYLHHNVIMAGVCYRHVGAEVAGARKRGPGDISLCAPYRAYIVCSRFGNLAWLKRVAPRVVGGLRNPPQHNRVVLRRCA